MEGVEGLVLRLFALGGCHDALRRESGHHFVADS